MHADRREVVCWNSRLSAAGDWERWIERIKFFKRNCLGVIFDAAGLKAVDNADELARESPQSLYWVHNRVTQHEIYP
jgi:hypothetical protein